MNDFFAFWYELLADLGEFSNNMYDSNLYATIGIFMLLIPIVVLAIYYYVVDSVMFNKRWQWLLLVIALCIINFGIAFGVSYYELSYMYEQQNKVFPYSIELVNFSFINALYTFVVSLIWSSIIKWGSKNCRRTPF